MRVFHFPLTCSGCVQKFGFCVIYSLLLARKNFFPIIFFSEQLILFHFLKLTVNYLLCSTKCLSFSQHFSKLDAMFLSSGRMTSFFRFIPSILLGIHCVYSRTGTATQSNGYSVLFHLFLFRNKVNQTLTCDQAFFFQRNAKG